MTSSDMRIHNSTSAIKVLHEQPQVSGVRKPIGLWWSRGAAWTDYLERNRSKSVLKRHVGAFAYEVAIDPGCRIVQLRDWQSILDFTIQFGAPNQHAQRGFFWQKDQQVKYDPAQDDFLTLSNACRVSSINWTAVAQQYDAIEVLELEELKPARPYVPWLDIDWAVSSGCAWRFDHVQVRLCASHPNVIPQTMRSP